MWFTIASYVLAILNQILIIIYWFPSKSTVKSFRETHRNKQQNALKKQQSVDNFR